MENAQIRRILVVDDKGSCVGMVAQADIARKATESETATLVKDVSA
jgi:CBS domain-containing protein